MVSGDPERRHRRGGKLLARLLAQYDMELVDAEEIPSANNQVYRATTSRGVFAVRLHRPGARTMEQIALETRLLDEVERVGSLEAPAVMRTSGGEPIARFATDDTELFVTVLRWIPGRVRRPGAGAGPATARRIGECLAHLHEVSAAWPESAVAPSIEPAELILPLLPSVGPPAHRKLIETTVAGAVALFGDIPHDATHRGVVHNDVIFSNCVHRGNATALIDFDDCGRAPFLQDLGAMLENIAGETGAARLRAAFLDGYASVRPLPAEDEVALDTVTALRHAWTTAWSYGRAATGDFSAERMEAIAEYRMAALEGILEGI